LWIYNGHFLLKFVLRVSSVDLFQFKKNFGKQIKAVSNCSWDGTVHSLPSAVHRSVFIYEETISRMTDHLNRSHYPEAAFRRIISWLALGYIRVTISRLSKSIRSLSRVLITSLHAKECGSTAATQIIKAANIVFGLPHSSSGGFY
jgi:hypothetical protein